MARNNSPDPMTKAKPGQPLSDTEKAALDTLIQDEMRGRDAYNNVLATFGQVRPFSNIVKAEERHIAVLKMVYERYGLTAPEDVKEKEAPKFASVKKACEWAIGFEKDNAALYEKYLAQTDRTDVQNVFTMLRNASLYHHLPAFERCVARR